LTSVGKELIAQSILAEGFKEKKLEGVIPWGRYQVGHGILEELESPADILQM
jgi:hypothetical protein